MDKSFGDVPSFFSSWLNGQTFYRPFSREVFNLLMYKTFGLNPLPFHIVNLSLIFILACLIFIFAKLLTHNKLIGLVAVLLYSLSSIHNVELYYLASVQTLLAAAFMLSSLICYLKFLFLHGRRYYIPAVVFYILAILSHESSVIFPALVFLLESLIKNKVKIKSKLFNLFPFILIGGVRISLLLILRNLPSQLVYLPIFNLKSIINTFMWYTLWNFNLPELLPDFIGSGFKVNPNFFKWYGHYSLTVFPLVLLLFLLLTIYFFKYKKSIFKDRLLLLIVSFYVTSLLPFLFFPQHKFVYYLSFPLVWFSVAIALLLSNGINKFMTKITIIIFLISFGVLGFKTNQLNSITYWAAKRANAAEFLLSDIKSKIPEVFENESIYITKDPNYPFIANEWGDSSKQAFYILSGADAFKLLYRKPDLKVYFEGINEPPIGEKIVEYRSKFPY